MSKIEITFGTLLMLDSAESAKETRKSKTRAEIQLLDDIHRGLDTAMPDAYG